MVLFYVSIDLSLNLLLCFREIVTKFDALENSVADPHLRIRIQDPTNVQMNPDPD